MASSLTRSTIACLVPNDRATEKAIYNSQNVNRLITKGYQSTTIQLSFEIQPKNLQHSFVFGNSESCDVKLSAGESAFSGRLFSINVVKKRSFQRGGHGLICPAIRNSGSSHFRELKQNMVVKGEGFSFTVKIPSRGHSQWWYDWKIADYFRYIVCPRLFLDLPDSDHWAGTVGSFDKSNVVDNGDSEKTPIDKSKISRRISNLKSISHENIVKYNGILEGSSSLYLLMEYLPNRCLAWRKPGRTEPHTAVEILSQCLEALSYLHERKTMHRSICPENIMIKREDPLHIKLIGLEITHDNLAYTAPEALFEGKRGAPADVWSLGITILVQLQPLPADEMRNLSRYRHKVAFIQYHRALCKIIKKVPQPLSDVLGGMLKLDPKDRLTVKQCRHYIPKLQQAFTPPEPFDLCR
ncbi:hypothetical protein FQN54_004603 [Arachnomyces sp. PD_36]|nr:hypothetical protein FQN54_004603 [Arachnomyces sp. PD_36]